MARDKEKAILVGLNFHSSKERDIEESLNELQQLALTAGAEVVARVSQVKEKPDARTYIGPGKVDEIKTLAESFDADLIIFDNDLSASQQHNLEDIINRKIIDRTAIILDIFAQHAHSSEGKLQVELAQLDYLLPRLTGKGIELSRLGGGIGTRGPGETKLEVDRRRIRHRITYLKRELKHIAQNRALQRKKRKKAEVYLISLVGYTNAGKSTLLNSLTEANVIVEDKLFATLDSTARRLILPNKQAVILSDTVGFIHKLPHQLVVAFHSTLEEVRQADLLIHVIDASHPRMKGQIEAVNRVLGELGVAGSPVLNAFNKADLIDEESRQILQKSNPDGVLISAKTGYGLQKLLERIEKKVPSTTRVSLEIPFSRGDLVQKIHQKGTVISEKYSEAGTRIVAEIPHSLSLQVKKFIIKT